MNFIEKFLVGTMVGVLCLGGFWVFESAQEWGQDTGHSSILELLNKQASAVVVEGGFRE